MQALDHFTEVELTEIVADRIGFLTTRLAELNDQETRFGYLSLADRDERERLAIELFGMNQALVASYKPSRQHQRLGAIVNTLRAAWKDPMSGSSMVCLFLVVIILVLVVGLL